MQIRRYLAGACAVAGVAVLAGLGWALLAAAALLLITPEPQRLHAAAGRARAGIRAAWRWLKSGRQAIAAASMPIAILCIAAGLSMAIGVGWGITAAGVVVGGLSIAADKSE